MSTTKNSSDGQINGHDDTGDHNNNNGKHEMIGKGMAKPIPNHGSTSSASNADLHQHSPTTEANMKKFMKNSRRSRSRFGRGLAKKGNVLNTMTIHPSICLSSTCSTCDVISLFSRKKVSKINNIDVVI